MIYDNISNIDKYALIPQNIRAFIKTLNEETPEGRYEIDEMTYANVNIYDTKSEENCRLEAHKVYTDIQILLSGEERLDFIDLEGLEIEEDFTPEKDLMFYELPNKKLNSLKLYKGVFAMLHPHEAHMPQVNICNESQTVKKVVVKMIPPHL